MKKTITLNESQLRRIIRQAVNEVVYDGVSYHGTSPFDWADLAAIRRQRMYDAPTEEEEDKEIDAYARNKANAKELGYNGPSFPCDINNARMDTAKQLLNKSYAQTDQAEKSKYARMATDALGDVAGRIERDVRGLRRESRLRDIVSETIKKVVNEYGSSQQ